MRYYEKQELLHPDRLSNGYRDYPESSVEQVKQIRALLESGFSTELIAKLLSCVQGPNAELPPTTTVEMAERLRLELEDLTERINSLSHSRDQFECYLRRVDGLPHEEPSNA